ncbi:hypothetical protein PoB_001557700 [Plakobranchus ocellatus]|uniref:Uncharacterized protein n=1 Tax=Plakobranchus ocellatus TaxID=259542 RepID=A0AAV3Z1K5_9GAST|nr:hypothetical protein PoB_001557700 [Plakobranchus ocellatus]
MLFWGRDRWEEGSIFLWKMRNALTFLLVTKQRDGLLLAITFHFPVFDQEMLVPWKESKTVVELGLWSMWSITPTVKSFLIILFGTTSR